MKFFKGYFTKLDLIFLFACAFTVGVLFALDAHGKQSIMDVAHYRDEGLNQVNWENISLNDMIEEAVQEPVTIDLTQYFKKIAIGKTGRDALQAYNSAVNQMFYYNLDDFNMWRAQRPAETLILGSGDCKAMGVFKYHLLKQLGYKNVKLITVTMPNGYGGFAGHVVTIVDDLWVMDINYPFFYPFAYLRADNLLERSFDDTGVHLVLHQ